jgi:multidrug efflux system outer membrane protein
MKRWLVFALPLALAACINVGPDYRQPQLHPPQHWRAAGADTQPIISGDWWKLFHDSTLDRLIDSALAQNRDLKIAAARVVEAQANLALARSQQFPAFNMQANAVRNRATMNGTPALPAGTQAIANDYTAAGSAAFEIDFWGKFRRATEAARASLLATEYAQQVTRLTLIADAANAYFNLRSLDAQLQIARRTLQSRRESLALQQKRYHGGVVPELDVRQAEVDVQTAAVTIPGLENQIATQENTLSTLLGRYPGNIGRGATLADLTAPPQVPAGLPSSLLARRPDVLEAEQQLIAANADIGVAKAAYFPSISLTGLLGVESAQLASLFSAGSHIWQAGVGATLPIFNAGATGARVAAATAQQQQALQFYLRTVETAFADVDSALVAVRTTRQQYAAQHAQVRTLQRTLKLANLQYQNGATAYLTVLDSERTLFSSELSAAQMRQAQLSAIVRLYTVLGGGWQTPPAASTTTGKSATGTAPQRNVNPR